MNYFRPPVAGGAPQPREDQRVQAEALLVNHDLDAAALEIGQARYQVIERINQHSVATAQQLPRQDDELPLCATRGEAADHLEDPHRHLGIISVAHPARVPHLEGKQQPQLILSQPIASPEACQQAPDELRVEDALSGNQAGFDVPVDQYAHVLP